MIQRIQTLFLLLTAIITGLLFFMPVALLIVPTGDTYAFYTTKVLQTGEEPIFIAYNWMSFILNLQITALPLVTLFLYKKRFLQLRLCMMNIILLLGMLVLMWIQVSNRMEEIDAQRQIQLAFCFPLVGVILTWLALRGIIKDIAILKSYDRIR